MSKAEPFTTEELDELRKRHERINARPQPQRAANPTIDRLLATVDALQAENLVLTRALERACAKLDEYTPDTGMRQFMAEAREDLDKEDADGQSDEPHPA